MTKRAAVRIHALHPPSGGVTAAPPPVISTIPRVSLQATGTTLIADIDTFRVSAALAAPGDAWRPRMLAPAMAMPAGAPRACARARARSRCEYFSTKSVCIGA